MAKSSIAVIGGTGELGTGLAGQLLKAGYEVVIGSRSEEKAEKAAAALADKVPGARVSGYGNAAAAREAGIVIVTVPYASHDATLADIAPSVQGKVLVDATVPLKPPKVMRVQLPEGGSAAREAQERLGDAVRVVSAFQNIAASHLRGDHLQDVCGDVLVCGNDPEARETVVRIAQDLGLTAWHAGPIDNSVVAEALTSVLIFMNRKYEMDGAGIRIIGKGSTATA